MRVCPCVWCIRELPLKRHCTPCLPSPLSLGFWNNDLPPSFACHQYESGWLYLMDEKNDNDGNFTWDDVHTFLRDDHPKFYSNCAGCISCVQSCCL